MSPGRPPVAPRAVAPVATVLVLVTVVGLGAVVAGATLGLATDAVPDADAGVAAGPPPALSLSVVENRLVFVHRGGRTLDVTRLRFVVSVDGEPLRHQPPVPFFAATGFRAGPTGPFNSAADPAWRAGERASLRVASTNDPTLSDAGRVVVRVYEAGQPIARLRAG